MSSFLTVLLIFLIHLCFGQPWDIEWTSKYFPNSREVGRLQGGYYDGKSYMIYGRTLDGTNQYSIYIYDHASDSFSDLSTPNYATTKMETSDESYVSIGNRVYFWASGSKDFLHFSSDTNEFEYIPEINGDDLQGCCMTQIDALIYIIGGGINGQQMQTFNFIHGYTTTETMPFGRRNHGCKAYGNTIYVFAGLDTVNGGQSQEIWKWESGTWTKLNTQFPHQFPYAHSVIFNGGIVLVSTNWGRPYIFDPTTESLWQSANELPNDGLASGPLMVHDSANDKIALFSRLRYSFGTVITTAEPTSDPSSNPTKYPTGDPTVDPTIDPTTDPTMDPSRDPTNPSMNPTVFPSVTPTKDPSTYPSIGPTRSREEDDIVATNDNNVATSNEGGESGINDVSTTVSIDETSADIVDDSPLILGLNEDAITIYFIASVAGLCCCVGVLCTALIGCFFVQREKNQNKHMAVTATSPRSMSVNSENDVFNEGSGGVHTEMTSITNEQNKKVVVKVTDKDQKDSTYDEPEEKEKLRSSNAHSHRNLLPEDKDLPAEDTKQGDKDEMDEMYRQTSAPTPQD